MDWQDEKGVDDSQQVWKKKGADVCFPSLFLLSVWTLPLFSPLNERHVSLIHVQLWQIWRALEGDGEIIQSHVTYFHLPKMKKLFINENKRKCKATRHLFFLSYLHLTFIKPLFLSSIFLSTHRNTLFALCFVHLLQVCFALEACHGGKWWLIIFKIIIIILIIIMFTGQVNKTISSEMGWSHPWVADRQTLMLMNVWWWPVCPDCQNREASQLHLLSRNPFCRLLPSKVLLSMQTAYLMGFVRTPLLLIFFLFKSLLLKI